MFFFLHFQKHQKWYFLFAQVYVEYILPETPGQDDQKYAKRLTRRHMTKETHSQN